ncbi:hypothetical protein H1S01_19555 [Heliobacterium chlorum]|uniref:Uncharacterized protein n=1 Tax=Heliobacterium chlorum TaxID=2698 RepID=A0ABR7T7A2_HELCL|nr:hypothetical protein [Heliobacterium chlorum]MBC9786643.1 hypothetical protein [Heliobacterium chlorum]
MDEEALSIGSRCIFKVNGKFFLLAEIEAKVPGVEIDPIVIIRITNTQARRLLNDGVKLCRIRNNRPIAMPGFEVEFKCIFIDGKKAFRIFDIENSTDEAVLVRTPLDRALRLIRQGARRCTVIRRPFPNIPLPWDE